MSEIDTIVADDLATAEISDDLKQEIAIYRKLKPIIGQCLTLNHDINNPLAGILGFAEFMQEGAAEMSDDQREHLRRIVQCAEMIRKLVNIISDKKAELAEELDMETVITDFREAARPSK